ncbi:MAG: DUF1501 domain-containing protein [Verrucomicrobiales bacterium]|nr:DUF1501 domain-containing protein [Verrucomicrobiales bacterium]
MFTVYGDSSPRRRCDGLSRRSFLRTGLAGFGGGMALGLPDLLRAEAAAGVGRSSKAVILVHLDGGPPQMDLIDPKPDAPAEIRGEFGSIPTRLPGVHVTELMPRVAAMADRFAFIRSLVGSAGKHDAYQAQSGFTDRDLASIGGWPAMGCVVGSLLGSPGDAAPAFVDIMQGRGKVRNSARPGFLGPVHQAFRPDISHLFQRELEPGMKGELARLGARGQGASLGLPDGVSLGRLEDRAGLLRRLDTIRRDLEPASSQVAALDQFSRQAVDILTSGRLAEAMDLEREDRRVLDRYTPVLRTDSLAQYTSEGPQAARKLLLARRLIEAGVRVVSVSISDFDTHSHNFPRMRQLGPILDHALAALVEDLTERGMLDDVCVVAWGEFGRTPKINRDGGRDHWPKVGMALMAGGGLRTGQVIGATDSHAAEVTERPVTYPEVFATLYRHLGIDPATAQVYDPTGRPQYLTAGARPIGELI